jgi:hypothetical protein
MVAPTFTLRLTALTLPTFEYKTPLTARRSPTTSSRDPLFLRRLFFNRVFIFCFGDYEFIVGFNETPQNKDSCREYE